MGKNGENSTNKYTAEHKNKRIFCKKCSLNNNAVV